MSTVSPYKSLRVVQLILLRYSLCTVAKSQVQYSLCTVNTIKGQQSSIKFFLAFKGNFCLHKLIYFSTVYVQLKYLGYSIFETLQYSLCTVEIPRVQYCWYTSVQYMYSWNTLGTVMFIHSSTVYVRLKYLGYSIVDILQYSIVDASDTVMLS